MDKELVLILGGARSGKSTFALSLADGAEGRVVFVATAQPGDEEMRERIARHRRERPERWRTIEAPIGVGEAIRSGAADAEVVVLDCLSFLVANVMGEGSDASPGVQKEVEAEVEGLLRAFEQGNATFILVSNEVGMGVVPAYASGRLFRDVLGLANQRLARAADRVYWMVASMPIEVKASGVAARWEDPRGRA